MEHPEPIMTLKDAVQILYLQILGYRFSPSVVERASAILGLPQAGAVAQPVDTSMPSMNPDDFELQPSTAPQPRLLDGECATRDWPMPAAKKWVPHSAAETAEREAMVRAPRPDPAEERNPIARALTRLMTWGRR